jgi:hypothetical protein
MQRLKKIMTKRDDLILEPHLHEVESCALKVPTLAPTRHKLSATLSVRQSSLPFSYPQPAKAPVGKHGGIKGVYLDHLHLQPASMN